MFIETQVLPIHSCVEPITDLAERFFELNAEQCDDFRRVLQSHINRLNDSLYVFVEGPYVDRVYRDSYYHYFSTKLGSYPKHCLRLSFFSTKIDGGSFRGSVDKNSLQKHYLGFVVLRPTIPQVIGRSVLSPHALKNRNLNICVTDVPVTVNAIKLTATGFPHSSQDTETITCAETTVWALMEYFGHRYANYRPVLPSEIISVLRSQSYERQWPSKGLAVDQISFALRELGFATRIYSKQAHGSDFYELLSCYVESGIPIAVTIDNHDGIAHALLCIGREPINASQVPTTPPRVLGRSIRIVDNDRIARNFVFIDDNMPAYVKADLTLPAANYPNEDWQRCEIDYFIVPLYGKVYLEAFEAKRLVENFLVVGPYPLPEGYELFLRFYLTSSRSYKEYVATQAGMQSELQTLILGMALPKFIWVAELSTNELIEHSQANGVIILDATEANVLYYKPMVFAAYQNKLFTFAEENTNATRIQAINFELTTFSIYENNLKPFSDQPY
ncbi:hypothetical protein ACFSUS_21900 [Spirosoma soli]|uniref:Uncharacterized protein n=1 Tax=Spirosoma soli TaxID=1770529 RepID=A0ABW5MA88_9BACT